MSNGTCGTWYSWPERDLKVVFMMCIILALLRRAKCYLSIESLMDLVIPAQHHAKDIIVYTSDPRDVHSRALEDIVA
jgi:hypothetical protein